MGTVLFWLHTVWTLFLCNPGLIDTYAKCGTHTHTHTLSQVTEIKHLTWKQLYGRSWVTTGGGTNTTHTHTLLPQPLFCGCQGRTEARRRPHKGNICPVCPSKLSNWRVNFPIARACVSGRCNWKTDDALNWAGGSGRIGQIGQT